MEVIVLGGGPACPNPGQGSAGYLIRHEKTVLMVDCGPGTVPELRKQIKLNHLSGVIISHVHSDHVLDLIPLRYGLKYITDGENLPLPLLLPPEAASFIHQYGNHFAIGQESDRPFFDDVFDLKEYDPAFTARIDSIQITFLRTQHPVACWAMRFETLAGVVTYSADSGPIDELAHFARNSDVFICEATELVPPKGVPTNERPHLTATEAGQIAREAGVKHLIISHFWHERDPEIHRRNAMETFRGPVHLSAPGLRIAAKGNTLQ